MTVPADYPLDGLQIAYNPDRGDHVLLRAEPRAVVTSLMLRDIGTDERFADAPARIEPAAARAALAAGDLGWWQAATLSVRCARGVHDGRALYRFVGEDLPRDCYLVEWPD